MIVYLEKASIRSPLPYITLTCPPIMGPTGRESVNQERLGEATADPPVFPTPKARLKAP